MYIKCIGDVYYMLTYEWQTLDIRYIVCTADVYHSFTHKVADLFSYDVFCYYFLK